MQKRNESVVAIWRRVMSTRKAEVLAAMEAYRAATGGWPISHAGENEVRMAVRINAGRTLDECVAREIAYRVSLAWHSPALWLLPAGWLAGTEAGE